MSEQSASIQLSKEHKGRPRRTPVWIGRYLVVGKDSARGVGKAWTKRSRPPQGYLTRAQAEDALRELLMTEGAVVKAAQGVTFGRAADAYVASLEARITSGSFRASTLRPYANIIANELRPRWGDRKVASVTREEIAAYRTALASRKLAATTLNQTHAIVRGIFPVAVERFGLEHDVSIAFKRAKMRRATSKMISFYPPEEVLRLVQHADSQRTPRCFSPPRSPACGPASCGRCAGARSTSMVR